MRHFEWLDSAAAPGAARDFALQGTVRRVTGALWLPASFDSNTPMVLLGHGASGDRNQAPIPHLCQRFAAECGYISLAVDGPVHGLRQVGVGGREALAGEMQREGFVDDMVADWHDAFSAVAAECDIGKGRLGYFGLSMGSLFGIPLLAGDDRFKGSVIGLCGVTGAAAAMAERLLRDAAGIAHPVLFLMQLEDELFPRDGYLELFDGLGAEDKRLHANPGLHPEVPAEEVAAAFEFLQARLAGDVPRPIVNPLAE